MRLVDYFYLAKKDIWNFKLRSNLIILCLTLGILVSSLNFYHTLKRAEDMVKGVEELGGDLIIVNIEDEDISLEDLSFLSSYFPKTSYQMITLANLRYLKKSEDISLLGIDQFYPQVTQIKLKSGRFLNTGDIKEKRKVCLVTSGLASKLDIKIGSLLRINDERLRVIGIWQDEDEAIGQGKVLIPLSITYLFVDSEQKRQKAVIIQEKGKMDNSIQKMLNKRFPPKKYRSRMAMFGENERIWVMYNEGLETMVRELKSKARFISLGIGLFTLVLAGGGIINLMMLLTKQRYKEIGIMRAFGAKEKDIFYLFFIESSLLSFYGLGLGSLLGFFYVTLFGECRFGLFLEGWLWSSLVCVGASLCGYFPAEKAAKILPCEAIREKDLN